MIQRVEPRATTRILSGDIYRTYCGGSAAPFLLSTRATIPCRSKHRPDAEDRMRKAFALALGVLLLAPVGAMAQIAGGNLYGTVTDESGAVMPGAAVTLTSDLGNRSTTTSSQGDFRFIGLDRGRYKITVSLAGFTGVSRDVNVNKGENVK